MPKRKITLEEAFAVFEQHGLQVEVKGVEKDTPEVELSAFLESTGEQPIQLPQPVGKRLVKITLYAAHTIASAGESFVDKNGKEHLINMGVESYGPGVVTVPVELAQQLLHQDGLARQGDERMLDRKLRSFAIIPRVTQYGIVNSGVQVSEQGGFDLSGFLGRLSEGQTIVI